MVTEIIKWKLDFLVATIKIDKAKAHLTYRRGTGPDTLVDLEVNTVPLDKLLSVAIEHDSRIVILNKNDALLVRQCVIDMASPLIVRLIYA